MKIKNQISNIKMVDVGKKPVTERLAKASCRVLMNADTLKMVKCGEVPKGDVFSAAKVAGIMAAKKTSELIPLCHPLEISHVEIELKPNRNSIPHPVPQSGTGGIPLHGRKTEKIETTAVKPWSFIEVTSMVKCYGKTGVEMEALTAAAISALTIYDMCKPIDKDIVISDLKLLEKRGGKSGTYKRNSKIKYQKSK